MSEKTALLIWAKILYQNSVNCAAFHHGHDIELNGLPGWLAALKHNLSEAA